MATDFTLPELGENIDASDVLRVLVKPGDTIAKDQRSSNSKPTSDNQKCPRRSPAR
jgi:hypothetical protein